MVGAIFHAPRSSVAVPIALPYAGRANSHNDDERNFLKKPLTHGLSGRVCRTRF